MTDRMSVLVADDEPIIRQKVRMMLEQKFSVQETADADSTRRALEGGPDAVLLDIMFPDGNGIDICREAKGREPHVTVIITSSLETADAWNQAFQAGADGYLEKRELLGLDPRKIVVMIENLVDRNKLRRQFVETSRRQADLLSVLSHDVRAPFQALLGTIDLLRKCRIPPEAATNVENLFRCAKDQLAFINSLLDLLRLESGTVGLRTRKMDVNLPVGQCIQSLNVLAAAKDIAIVTDLQSGLPAIDGDIGRIAQLANNLLGNAVKFTHRGGRIDVKTRLSTRMGTPGVEISVKDNGIGIPEAERERILQRFHRGRERGTEGETGTGLGLAICKEIVQLQNGVLDIRQAKPNGTVVIVWFPSCEEDAGARQFQTKLATCPSESPRNHPSVGLHAG